MSVIVQQMLKNKSNHVVVQPEKGVDGETPIGTIALSDIVGIPVPERAGRRVVDVMRPLTSERCLDSGLSGRGVIERLDQAGSEPLAVVRDGRVVGLIHRGDIVKWLALNGP